MTDSRCRAWGAWWSLRRPPGAGYWAGVVTEPMPCRPVGFWNDPDGHRYRDSYFDLYPGVWRHGDWIKVTARGSDELHAIPEVPCTLTGKKLEVPVRRILLGQPPEQVLSPGALSNPESIRYFVTLAKPVARPS